MRSEHQFAYHARAFKVPPNASTVFCHHGAAYALTVGAPLGVTNLPFTAKTTVATARSGIEANTYPTGAFADDEGKFLRPASSWAAFYWTLRWDVMIVDGKPTPRERVQIDDLSGLTKL